MADPGSNSGLAGLPHTVVRIRAGDRNNANLVHRGTGFYYTIEHNGQIIPLAVSNKHVLCGKAWVEFDFATSDDAGGRIFGPATAVRVDSGQLPVCEHPDAQIDLAAMPLNPIFEDMRNRGVKPHATSLSKENFPPPHVQAVLHAATGVLMVGFPNGIMDEVNNLPVVRRGSLATPYRANYLGQSNFVADIAAFGGSSGSPVFAFFEHLLPNDKGGVSLLPAPQIYLLGVLHSGPTMTAQGNIVPAPVPTTLVAATNVMIHLGYCVKAYRIEELLSAIVARMPDPP